METNDSSRPEHTGPLHRRLVRHGKHFVFTFSTRGIATCASSVAFFFFLSLIPLVILLSLLLPYLGIGQSMVFTTVTAMTPDSVDALLIRILGEAYVASARILPPTILLLIWSSAAGMLALIRGLNRVYDTKEHRNYFVLVLFSILYTVILLLLFISMMFLAVFNNTLRDFLLDFISDKDNAVFVFEGFHYQIAFVLSVVIFMAIYTFVPSGRRRFLLQLPGAVFTSGGFLVFSYFFSLYLSGANRYTLFYGSLSGTAIFLFWLYCCFYILLVGAYLNQYFEEALQKLLGRRNDRTESQKEQT